MRGWGGEGDGELGGGGRAAPRRVAGEGGASPPPRVVGNNNADANTPGAYHSCALLGDHTMRCWGRNVDGQLGDGTRAPLDCVPGSCGSSTPMRVVGITSADAITAGAYHTCALLGDRTVQCWGRNDDGQLGDGTWSSSSTPARVGGLTGVAAVSGGGYPTSGALGGGAAVRWGRKTDREPGGGRA